MARIEAMARTFTEDEARVLASIAFNVGWCEGRGVPARSGRPDFGLLVERMGLALENERDRAGSVFDADEWGHGANHAS